MIVIWRNLNHYGVIVDGYKLPYDPNSQTTRYYQEKLNQAAAISIEVISDVILEKIFKIEDSYLM